MMIWSHINGKKKYKPIAVKQTDGEIQRQNLREIYIKSPHIYQQEKKYIKNGKNQVLPFWFMKISEHFSRKGPPIGPLKGSVDDLKIQQYNDSIISQIILKYDLQSVELERKLSVLMKREMEKNKTKPTTSLKKRSSTGSNIVGRSKLREKKDELFTPSILPENSTKELKFRQIDPLETYNDVDMDEHSVRSFELVIPERKKREAFINPKELSGLVGSINHIKENEETKGVVLRKEGKGSYEGLSTTLNTIQDTAPIGDNTDHVSFTEKMVVRENDDNILEEPISQFRKESSNSYDPTFNESFVSAVSNLADTDDVEVGALDNPLQIPETGEHPSQQEVADQSQNERKVPHPSRRRLSSKEANKKYLASLQVPRRSKERLASKTSLNDLKIPITAPFAEDSETVGSTSSGNITPGAPAAQEYIGKEYSLMLQNLTPKRLIEGSSGDYIEKLNVNIDTKSDFVVDFNTDQLTTPLNVGIYRTPRQEIQQVQAFKRSPQHDNAIIQENIKEEEKEKLHGGDDDEEDEEKDVVFFDLTDSKEKKTVAGSFFRRSSNSITESIRAFRQSARRSRSSGESKTSEEKLK